ncbi:uroporphyrinogen decarboxylase family protein [Paludicola sp. MB14-C6]|uniref:uroporphyrinogen decarboxylase family protein n=1 Tax=Paludihabitans sp. MB14-C6 TaxID=3070656 RepID=UPI0027DD24FB|nr:uroporphyrinogen decarboxylase family protein [Paludicola sp. MB14-C6]WMJ23587.1 uroporphyrinogen decarboxylase family protein [Paludicola sp. MB14-C6]
MTSLERVAATLSHKEPDHVPVYPILSGVTRKLTGASYKEWATNAEETAKAMIQSVDEFGIDCLVTLTDLSVEAADFGQEIVYPENEAAHPNYDNQFLQDIEDYDKVKHIDPRTTPRMSDHIKLCDLLVKAKGKTTPVVAFIFGPLGILSMLRGQEDLYMDLYDDPDAVHKALTTITDVLIDYSDALIETGINAIMVDTLFASSVIMSKEMWSEFEGPHVKRWADHVHSKGCMVMIHNCGNGVYFDVQIEAMHPQAISFLHVPADCASFEECKEKYGKDITLIGCVSPTWIATASVEEVIEESKHEIDLFKQGGGFMLATGCEYPANTAFDNAKAMIEVAKTYGRY